MKENDEKETGRPGPEPDRLKIDEKDWREAVKKALETPSPSDKDRSESDERRQGDANETQ